MNVVKRWCFTVNNPGEWRPTYSAATMDYIVWEVEHVDDGTPHIQGYVRFKRTRDMASAKRLLCERAHVEPARGSEEQNRVYCTKEGDDAEHGEQGVYDAQAGKQGRRTDLETVAERIRLGANPLKYLSLTGDRILLGGGSDEQPRRVDQVPQRDYEPSPEAENTTAWDETCTNNDPVGADRYWEDTPRTGVLPWFVFDQGWSWTI